MAHAGRRTLVLEKNKIVGGRCTSYEKDGFIVDLGVHLFGVGDKGSLGDVCRRIDMPDAIAWVTIDQPVLQVGDKIGKYSRANMMKTLPKEETDNLGRLFQEMARLTPADIDELWYVPLEEWVNRFSRDPKAHAFIQMIGGQYFRVGLDSARTAEFINSFQEVVMARGSAYPRGGCIAIPKAYLSGVEKYGGRYLTEAGVRRVIVENGAAVGGRLEDGTEFRAPVIISNADIKVTVSDLVGPEHFPADYVERINGLTWSYHCMALKVALEERITGHQLLMYQPYGTEDGKNLERKLSGELLPDLVPGMVTAPTNYDPSLAPAGRQMIFYGTACPAKADWKKWGKVLLDSFFACYPRAKGKVLWHRLDTPDLVNAYAGESGNIIGVGQTVDQIKDRRPSVVTPLPGLYLASAEAGGHGIGTELAADSARELCDILTAQ